MSEQNFTLVYEDEEPGPRRCGGCTLCCRLLPVAEIQKASSTRCKHQSFKGCDIWHKPGFPISCTMWSCRWLTRDDTLDIRRPDRCHYVIDTTPDVVSITDNATGKVAYIEAVQVWVDPKFRDAWREPKLLAFLDRRGQEGKCAIIRWNGSEGFVLFPPSMSNNGRWQEESGTPTPELSPQERFDRLAKAAEGRVRAAANKEQETTP
jgi:hypothetical protein